MKKFALGGVALILVGCFYGYDLQAQHVALDKTTCETKPDRVHLFFEGESIDFQYKKIGILQVDNGLYNDMQSMIWRIKENARNNCANAIIGLSKDVIKREAGMAFDTPQDSYQATSYHGITVAIQMDSVFLAKYGNTPDTSFMDSLRQREIRKAKSDEVGILLTISVAITGVIAAVMMSSMSK